ncbi:MAG: threonine synthase [Anaerolineales bacterium]|nr:threonine synthase [Anaerolineales bacterium]
MTGSLPTSSIGPFVTNLRCLRCGRTIEPTSVAYVCNCSPNAGSDMGFLNIEYDYAAIAAAVAPTQITADPDHAIGRYWPLLPIADRRSLPPLVVGATPLTHARRLCDSLGLSRLYVKDDGRNPSASLKDRASAIAVARAQEGGWPIVATASTGNAAAALASQAAAANQPSIIFVPKTAPQAKIAQLLVFGATVLAIDGVYDQAFDLCMEACAEFGWYNRNTGYNPYMTEGKKTVSFEIAEQLGFAAFETQTGFAAPDAVFVSVGDGSIVGGVHKGFKDLLALGWIAKMPRIYGVQSKLSPAIYQAWRDDRVIPEPVQATTRADSISVDAPRDAVKALNAIRQTGGAFIAVEDDAILAAILPLARLGAVFAEPAGATAFAGLQQAVAEGLVAPQETIVVINTGNGLKDVSAAIQVAGGVRVIEPSISAVRKALQTGS